MGNSTKWESTMSMQEELKSSIGLSAMVSRRQVSKGLAIGAFGGLLGLRSIKETFARTAEDETNSAKSSTPGDKGGSKGGSKGDVPAAKGKGSTPGDKGGSKGGGKGIEKTPTPGAKGDVKGSTPGTKGGGKG
jgi:hypothetical protein